eukprot:SAG31_NODE_12820_length_914_cov_1.136196_2_plen_40_part_01
MVAGTSTTAAENGRLQFLTGLTHAAVGQLNAAVPLFQAAL